jgi:hypothetical protein
VEGLLDLAVLAAERINLAGERADFIAGVLHLAAQRFDLSGELLLLIEERGLGVGRQFQFLFDG